MALPPQPIMVRLDGGAFALAIRNIVRDRDRDAGELGAEVSGLAGIYIGRDPVKTL